jgi:hypothetical protein
VLPDTLGLGPEVWRVLSKCHDMRNRTEYEGALDVDDRLVADLISACRKSQRTLFVGFPVGTLVLWHTTSDKEARALT